MSYNNSVDWQAARQLNGRAARAIRTGDTAREVVARYQANGGTSRVQGEADWDAGADAIEAILQIDRRSEPRLKTEPSIFNLIRLAYDTVQAQDARPNRGPIVRMTGPNRHPEITDEMEADWLEAEATLWKETKPCPDCGADWAYVMEPTCPNCIPRLRVFGHFFGRRVQDEKRTEPCPKCGAETSVWGYCEPCNAGTQEPEADASVGTVLCNVSADGQNHLWCDCQDNPAHDAAVAATPEPEAEPELSEDFWSSLLNDGEDASVGTSVSEGEAPAPAAAPEPAEKPELQANGQCHTCGKDLPDKNNKYQNLLFCYPHFVGDICVSCSVKCKEAAKGETPLCWVCKTGRKRARV